MLDPERVAVPPPICIKVPVPEIFPETVTLPVLLKRSKELLLMVLEVPRLPPVPTTKVLFAILIRPE